MERLKVIALLGKARSGKDTIGEMLRLAGGGVTLAFADKLKKIASEMYNLSRDALYTDAGKNAPTKFDCLMCPQCQSVAVEALTLDRVEHGKCNLCSAIGAIEVFRSKWTPRTILQYLGTEGFRRIDPEVWPRHALLQARDMLNGPRCPFVTITDCRFKSEAQMVWNAGGEVWRIRRPGTDSDSQGLTGHASETELDSIPDQSCQAVIMNDSTLENLQGAVNVQLLRFLARG